MKKIAITAFLFAERNMNVDTSHLRVAKLALFKVHHCENYKR